MLPDPTDLLKSMFSMYILHDQVFKLPWAIFLHIPGFR